MSYTQLTYAGGSQSGTEIYDSTNYTYTRKDGSGNTVESRPMTPSEIIELQAYDRAQREMIGSNLVPRFVTGVTGSDGTVTIDVPGLMTAIGATATARGTMSTAPSYTDIISLTNTQVRVRVARLSTGIIVGGVVYTTVQGVAVDVTIWGTI